MLTSKKWLNENLCEIELKIAFYWLHLCDFFIFCKWTHVEVTILAKNHFSLMHHLMLLKHMCGGLLFSQKWIGGWIFVIADNFKLNFSLKFCCNFFIITCVLSKDLSFSEYLEENSQRTRKKFFFVKEWRFNLTWLIYFSHSQSSLIVIVIVFTK